MKTTWQEIDSLMVISNCRKSPRLLAGTQRGEKKLSYQSSAPPSQLKLTLKKPKKSKSRGILWQSDRFVIYDSFKHTNSGYIFLPTGQIQDLTEERFVLVENVIVYFQCTIYGEFFWRNKAIMGNGQNSLLYPILCRQLNYFYCTKNQIGLQLVAVLESLQMFCSAAPNNVVGGEDKFSERRDDVRP